MNQNNLIIASSLILNSILIMFVTGPIPLLLFISILLNCGLFWYIRKLINNYSNINNDIDGIIDTLEGLEDHLKTVHDLEMYYGDETIQGLMDHVREVKEEIEIYSESYSFKETETLEDLEIELENLKEEVAHGKKA